ncbi:P-loop containing nucleoside triphosphate hydrolase protein, partial [Kickxella alabastrina]|uniref:P-loop containing nucleoside triphosphate hydrolase protein n=1 Tax=Kickxella alabastrina TaxID=61397 RepID=UPI00221FFB0A
VSNRQLFARLQADPNTIDKLDMLGLGSEKRGRFERKKWFRYDEPDVKLPHISFFAGAQVAASFPAASLPEIGFVGRSNVGKSTLINQICGSSAARVSDKPGMTQQINFYTADNDFHLVDMPGYGFAFAKDDERQAWQPLIESYIRQRKSLRRVMVLLDARHGIKSNDREFMALLDRMRVKYQFILTKCDLVHRIDLAKRHLLVSQEAEKSRNCIPRVMMVSARHGAGLNNLRKEIL